MNHFTFSPSICDQPGNFIYFLIFFLTHKRKKPSFVKAQRQLPRHLIEMYFEEEKQSRYH